MTIIGNAINVARKGVSVVKNNSRKAAVAGGSLLLTASAHAQTTPDPIDTLNTAATSSNTIWVAIAGLSATAFVFGMVIGFARKGKK